VLAELAQGRLREKLAELRRALEGRVRSHHRVLLRALLDHILFLEESIEQLDAEIEQALVPFAAQMRLLQSMPGVSRLAAARILAEIGPEISRSRECPPQTDVRADSEPSCTPGMRASRSVWTSRRNSWSCPSI
jgi:transposase